MFFNKATNGGNYITSLVSNRNFSTLFIKLATFLFNYHKYNQCNEFR